MGKRKRKNPDSQELGLRIAHIGGRYFLKTDHLHYGYWPEDLEVSLANLPEAQNRYTEFLCSKIAPGVQTILDVGCGTGHNAEVLQRLGYCVDCVSPSPYLSEQTEPKLNEGGTLFRCTFETLPTEKKYDCILFSESFQYIALEEAFRELRTHLNPDGQVLIMDFFRIPGAGTSAMGGGHRLARFREMLAADGFQITGEEDITERTAPNLQLVDEALQQFAIPLKEMVLEELTSNHGWWFSPVKFAARLFFKSKLDKIQYKYFSGARNADNFRAHKRYMCFQLKEARGI